MRKADRTSRSHAPSRLISRLMIPNLDNLSSDELIDLFISTAKQFEEEMLTEPAVEELDRLQVHIAVIKDEIYKKSHLSPEALVNGGYFYKSFINRN